MELHLGYEDMEPYALEWIEAPDVPQSLKVEDKLRLSKDRLSITVNPSLTLSGIPEAAFDYRLGNRSALEWVIDQYQVKRDPATREIVSDPNRYGPEDYIVNLIGRVVAVSVETVEIVNGLPEDFGG